MSATLTEILHNLNHHTSSSSYSSMMEKSQMFNNYYYGNGISTTSASEIEEENSSQLYLEDNGPLETISEENNESNCEDDSVYVAVGKSETSMEALTWTLKNLATSSTIVYLIHVFPEIKHIPNPLGIGLIPKSQVSPEQVESYMAQERGKRRELLHKFLQTCSACKVKVDTILIESDLVAKAILDLILILQITNLVLGANKSQLRKLRSRKGNGGIADQVLKNAPESCKVRIVCEGKEVSEKITGSPCPSPSPRANIANDTTSMSHKDQDLKKDSVSCICFNFRA